VVFNLRFGLGLRKFVFLLPKGDALPSGYFERKRFGSAKTLPEASK